MDEIDLFAHSRQLERVRRRSVAAAHNRNFLAAIERPVASRAIGHAPAGKFLFTRRAESAIFGTRGDYQCFCKILVLACGDREAALFALRLAHARADEFDPERLDLFEQCHRVVKAADPAQSRIVLDLAGVDNLSSRHIFLKERKLKSAPLGVDRRGHSGGACAHYRNVDLFHAHLTRNARPDRTPVCRRCASSPRADTSRTRSLCCNRRP